MRTSKKFKLFSVLMMLLMASSVMAKPVILLSDNKDDYTQTETGYILNFDLEASATDMDLINDRIASMDGRVKMESNMVKEGLYAVVYTVDHQNQPEYVHKMMMACGFQVIQHKGKTYGLNQIVDILYSYQ